MSKQKLKVWKIHKDATLPEVKTDGSVGYDITSVADYEFEDGDFHIVKTGLVVKAPKGYHVEIALRSSLTKRGLGLANGLGIVDQDYCGEGDELGVALCKNHKGKDNSFKTRGYGVTTKLSEPVRIQKGERIAQLLIRKSNLFDVVDKTDEEFEGPDRQGFGSTGRK